MESMESSTKGMSIFSIIGIIIVGSLVIYGLYSLITYTLNGYKVISSPENNARIKSEQLALLENKYMGHGRSPWTSSPLMSIPQNEQLLINSQPYSVRYAGYAGPTQHGVYDEDNMIRIMCEAGARLFILEVGMDKNHVTPYLIARDSTGYNNSNTRGSIKAVADALQKYGFIYGRSDPLIVYVHVHEYPIIGTEPKNYIAFCGEIASQLGGLESRFLTDSPQGTYGRQGLEDSLFFTPVKDYTGRAILMTNLDTSCFRKIRDYGVKSVKASQDLDLITHVRVVGQSTKLTKKPAAFSADASYWLATPPTMIGDAVTKNKETFSIVFPTEIGQMSADKYEKLLKTYGVNSVPFIMFEQDIDYMIGPDSPHYKTSWLAKSEGLRFHPPAPILISPADPKTNSNGGRIVAPSL